jgi:uncharacterized membrane protein SpoIIM required for sporulation
MSDESYLSRSFLITLAVAFTFLVISLAVVANSTYQTATMQEANQTLQQIQTERETTTAGKIFLNNLLVSFPLVIPAVGLFPFIIAWINTGQTIGLLSLATGIPPTPYVLNIVTLAFSEILAYTVLMSENLLLSYKILTKTEATARLKTQTLKSIIIYMALLILGAITEALMIAG